MSRKAGFTLVEMLVATTMLALLTAAGFAVLQAGTHAAAKSRRYNAMLSHGQAALQTMSNDIRSAVVQDKFALVSLDRQFEGRDADTIDFIAAKAPTMRVNDITDENERPPVGRCEVGYYIENDEDTEQRWLLRREDGTLDDDPREGGAARLAGPYVAALNFEFYDGISWESGWEDEDELPVAVRIQILVVDEDEQENPLVLFSTVPIMAQ